MRYYNYITRSLIILLASVCLSFSLVPSVAHADVKGQLQSGVDTAAGGSGANPEDKVNGIIKTIVNLLSIIGGIVAVVFIIVGGFRYITSSGDSGKVGTAKNTILYAIIGLVIIALAQVIVHFVLSKATGPVCTGGTWDSGPNKGKAC